MRSVWIVSLILLGSLAAVGQDTAQWELFGGYSHVLVDTSRSTSHMNGIHISAAENANRFVGGLVDFSGTFASQSGTTSNMQALLFGPQFSYRKAHTIVPSAHALFGLVRGSTGFLGNSVNGTHFGMGFGGALDLRIKPRIAFRVVQADYLTTSFQDLRRQNLRFSTGLVFGFGSSLRR